MHPYEISTTLRTRGKEQSIKLNYGSLYSVVESLRKHGLITSRETTREGRRPERTVYEITAEGVSEFEDWLAELLCRPVRDFTSLEAGLSLMGGLPPAEVTRLLEERTVALRIEIGAVEAGQRVVTEIGLPELFAVEDQFRLAMLTAELRFVQDLAERIRTEKLGGTAMWRRIHELRSEGLTFEQIMADPVGNLGPEAAVLRGGPREDAER
jgi:DNA-binding PadR family transcriptional regulator